MLDWNQVIKYANNGSPAPEKRVEKSENEWKELLTAEQFQIARLKGTERAGSGAFCERHEPGLYGCICCGSVLFDARTKFESGSGWPSFTKPVADNAIKYVKDTSWGMTRVEVLCNACDAHLGHVFPDGPAPSGLRFCINSASMQLIEEDQQKATAVFGGGCFWCTEAVFQQLKGVNQVVSGYAGGHIKNPTYREICSGRTGHAEVIEVSHNPNEIGYKDLLKIFFSTHDPTTLNRQGYDQGTQYRSIILTRDEDENQVAKQVREEMQDYFDDPMVTEIKTLEHFYPAEADHQNFYNDNPGQPYCNVIISPKLQKLRSMFSSFLKEEVSDL